MSKVFSLLALTVALNSQAALGQSAKPVKLKIAYFNLALVKASNPAFAQSDALSAQLRADIEEGCRTFARMGIDKKPQGEIKKMVADFHVRMAEKYRVLPQDGTKAIARAVLQIAQEKGVDVVVDGAQVWVGVEKLIDNGEDITEAVIREATAGRQPQ